MYYDSSNELKSEKKSKRMKMKEKAFNRSISRAIRFE